MHGLALEDDGQHQGEQGHAFDQGGGNEHQGAYLAGHLRLNKLCLIWDDNGISIDGPISVSESGDIPARFRAAGWNTDAVDGHDPVAILAALERAKKSDKPVKRAKTPREFTMADLPDQCGKVLASR